MRAFRRVTPNPSAHGQFLEIEREYDYGSGSRCELLRRNDTTAANRPIHLLVVATCRRVAVVVLAAQSGVAGCLALRLPPLEQVLRKPVTGSSYKKRNPGRDTTIGSCRDVVRVGRWFGGCDPAPCFSSSSLFACCYIPRRTCVFSITNDTRQNHLAKAQMPCVVDHECGKIDEGQCWCG